MILYSIRVLALLVILIALLVSVTGCAQQPIHQSPTYEWHGVMLCGNLLILEARGSDGNVVEWIGADAWHALIAMNEQFPDQDVQVWHIEQIVPGAELCGVGV